MVAMDKPSSSPGAVVNFLGVDAGYSNSSFSSVMHMGLAVSSDGYRWFVGAAPHNPNAPVVECLRGNEVWPAPGGQHTGCLSEIGDLGLDEGIWLRVQIVTYEQGYWIVRMGNPGMGVRVDVAKIWNPNTFLTRAYIASEESWFGTNPNENPWLEAEFYDIDFKYRSGAFYWAHMPSNIGGNYGSNSISEQSTSGASICPQHYGINNYIQGNPYLWYMGTGGSLCNGLLYTGGGPDTEVTSIVGEYSGMFMSSENGSQCIYTNRIWAGPWEQWHIENFGNNIVAYQGNNAKYINRRSNNSLWEDASNTNSNNSKFQYEEIAPYVFRLKNSGNNRYVDHNNGSSCTRAGTTTPGVQEIFRYVAF